MDAINYLAAANGRSEYVWAGRRGREFTGDVSGDVSGGVPAGGVTVTRVEIPAYPYCAAKPTKTLFDRASSLYVRRCPELAMPSELSRAVGLDSPAWLWSMPSR
ncbi:MAG: hypothetical protein HOW97_21825 [Catenulispora sp.]|nr:hypothetical protein [Catenulispora sp.]